MTSNLGSAELLEVKTTSKEEILKVVEPSLRRHFRPEFLNRLDEILPFVPLQEKDMEAIVALQLDRVKGRLTDQNIQLHWLPETVMHLAKKGYDPLYGARPLKRLIQNEVVNLLSTALLEGKIHAKQSVEIELRNEGLVLCLKNP